MFTAMHNILDESTLDSSVRIIIVTGGVKGFCAGKENLLLWSHTYTGGDLKHFISENGRWKFASLEYSLDRKINRLPLPYLSILDGVVMGGGVGISIHGGYRVVTDKTTWAMPEVCVCCLGLHYCCGVIVNAAVLTIVGHRRVSSGCWKHSFSCKVPWLYWILLGPYWCEDNTLRCHVHRYVDGARFIMSLTTSRRRNTLRSNKRYTKPS